MSIEASGRDCQLWLTSQPGCMQGAARFWPQRYIAGRRLACGPCHARQRLQAAGECSTGSGRRTAGIHSTRWAQPSNARQRACSERHVPTPPPTAQPGPLHGLPLPVNAPSCLFMHLALQRIAQWQIKSGKRSRRVLRLCCCSPAQAATPTSRYGLIQVRRYEIAWVEKRGMVLHRTSRLCVHGSKPQQGKQPFPYQSSSAAAAAAASVPVLSIPRTWGQHLEMLSAGKTDIESNCCSPAAWMHSWCPSGRHAVRPACCTVQPTAATCPITLPQPVRVLPSPSRLLRTPAAPPAT